MKQAIHLVILLAVLAFAGCDGGRRQQMEALLDRADSLNRAYVPMTGGLDSLLLEAARYYDRHGTANEQVRAHYLLGCAHRDMGEAPAALQCYQDAVDRADTLSPDCDYRRLMSVYGQMAELFDAQNLPEDELKIIAKYQRCALLVRDTLNYIKNIELMAKPYFLMGDTVRTLRALEHARQLYLNHGFVEEAASLYLPIVYYYQEQGKKDDAHRILNLFETQSGLLRSHAEIAPGYETYFYIKGMQCLIEDEIDLAEQYFRQLHAYPSENVNADYGLLLVYQEKGVIDSVVKYSHNYGNALDASINARRTETIHQMTSLYSYQRYKDKAEKDAAEARKARRTIHLIMVMCGFILSTGCFIIYKYRKRQRSKVASLLLAYENAQTDYKKIAEEVVLLKEDKVHLQKVKEAEMVEIKRQLRDLEIQLSSAGLRDDITFLDNKLIDTLHSKAKRKVNATLPTNAEWTEIVKQFRKSMPLAASVVMPGAVLTLHEQYVCLLLFLGFDHYEIVSLLDSSTQSISNTKSRINHKLFNDSSSASLMSNLRRKYDEICSK